MLYPKWSVQLPQTCAGGTGKFDQSTSRQVELQLLWMLLLPQEWLLKTGPVQSDVLLSTSVMLHLPFRIPALIKVLLGTVILFLQCHPWLRVLHPELRSQQCPGSASCSQKHCCPMVGSRGDSASPSHAWCQDQLCLTLLSLGSPLQLPLPLGWLSVPQCHFCC